MKYISLALLISLSAHASKLSLPNTKTREAMVLNLSQEILRLDGEGFIPRVNRPESWDSTFNDWRKRPGKQKIFTI
jgi:hypothetical protein